MDGKAKGLVFPAPRVAPLRGYLTDSSVWDITTVRRLLEADNQSAGGFGFLLVLRRLSPPSKRISEFSTKRSAIAVAMVVLCRILPQSENGVLVVISVLRLRLCRVEIT